MPPPGEFSTTFDTTVRPRLRLGAAWAVHVFTASGVVIGLLALLAVVDGDPRAALLWLGLAAFVDGLDGPAARKLGVREAIPRFEELREQHDSGELSDDEFEAQLEALIEETSGAQINFDDGTAIDIDMPVEIERR